MTKGEKAVLATGFIIFSLLPIWRSGLRENMILVEWIANHTVFGPPSEYIPPEYYLPDTPVPLEEEVSMELAYG